jgi:hypothetical protein
MRKGDGTWGFTETYTMRYEAFLGLVDALYYDLLVVQANDVHHGSNQFEPVFPELVVALGVLSVQPHVNHDFVRGFANISAAKYQHIRVLFENAIMASTNPMFGRNFESAPPLVRISVFVYQWTITNAT